MEAAAVFQATCRLLYARRISNCKVAIITIDVRFMGGLGGAHLVWGSASNRNAKGVIDIMSMQGGQKTLAHFCTPYNFIKY